MWLELAECVAKDKVEMHYHTAALPADGQPINGLSDKGRGQSAREEDSD